MTNTWMVNAVRTAVVPRGGALQSMQATELGAAVLRGVMQKMSICSDDVDYVIMGNALYGGGNPARIAALAAGIDESVPAMTLDSQCCGGMDACTLASALVSSGMYRCVLAGGLESYSRSPKRFVRSLDGGADMEYCRPAFTPWPDRDPDMLQAAAQLAQQYAISRAQQEDYAISSHQKARSARKKIHPECIAVAGVDDDRFTRDLHTDICQRLPPLTDSGDYALTSATIAVEADAAAVYAITSEEYINQHPHLSTKALAIAGTESTGADPTMPALAPIAATKSLLKRLGLAASDIDVCEVMEAFAVQAMVYIDQIGFDPKTVNRSGGALARGHPIGASGAIQLVRLFHEMHHSHAGYGLTAIAAAGGLGSAVLLSNPANFS